MKLWLALHLLLLMILQLYHLHFLSFLQSITLLACLLDISLYMPAVVLYYCTFQDNTVRLKMFYYLFVFFYVLLVWKYYSTELYNITCVHAQLQSCVRLFVTPWTVAH